MSTRNVQPAAFAVGTQSLYPPQTCAPFTLMHAHAAHSPEGCVRCPLSVPLTLPVLYPPPPPHPSPPPVTLCPLLQ